MLDLLAIGYAILAVFAGVMIWLSLTPVRRRKS